MTKMVTGKLVTPLLVGAVDAEAGHDAVKRRRAPDRRDDGLLAVLDVADLGRRRVGVHV